MRNGPRPPSASNPAICRAHEASANVGAWPGPVCENDRATNARTPYAAANTRVA